jgi:hypothetical protein
MHALIKWAACGACGYLLYKMAAGLIAERSAAGGGIHEFGPTRQPRQRSTPNMTGFRGEGVSVPVADSNGAERMAKVGRGVLS